MSDRDSLPPKEYLIQAIHENGHLARTASTALDRLAIDLESSSKPVKVTYADLVAFQTSIASEIDRTHDARRNGHLGDEGHLEHLRRLASLEVALGNALEAGVLMTQDTARGRIAGA